MNRYRIPESEGDWEPHPAGIPGVELKALRRRAEGWQSSIGYVRIAAGAIVPPHSHEGQDDNLLITAGRGRMRVADEVFDLQRGVQVSVPSGIEHEIYDVTEEIIVYDVFAPPAF